MLAKDISFMIDEVKEEANLTVGEMEYRVLFDVTAIEAFYKVFGINPAIEPVGVQPARWVALLWCGLLYYQPELNPSVVKGWFTSTTFVKLATATRAALDMTLPKRDPESETKPADPPIA